MKKIKKLLETLRHRGILGIQKTRAIGGNGRFGKIQEIGKNHYTKQNLRTSPNRALGDFGDSEKIGTFGKLGDFGECGIREIRGNI